MTALRTSVPGSGSVSPESEVARPNCSRPSGGTTTRLSPSCAPAALMLPNNITIRMIITQRLPISTLSNTILLVKVLIPAQHLNILTHGRQAKGRGADGAGFRWWRCLSHFPTDGLRIRSNLLQLVKCALYSRSICLKLHKSNCLKDNHANGSAPALEAAPKRTFRSEAIWN